SLGRSRSTRATVREDTSRLSSATRSGRTRRRSEDPCSRRSEAAPRSGGGRETWCGRARAAALSRRQSRRDNAGTGDASGALHSGCGRVLVLAKGAYWPAGGKIVIRRRYGG